LGALEMGAAWFYSMLTDAVDEAPGSFQGSDTLADGTPVIQRVNATKGLYYGLEGELAVQLWRLTLRAGATWTRGELTDGDGKTTPARRVPPIFGKVALKYAHPDQRFYGEILSRWATRQDALHPSDEKDLRICETSPFSGVTHSDLGDPCDGTPGWVTLGLRGGWRFTPQMRVDLSVLNLLDAQYRHHGSGFDAAGVDARLTISGQF
jgi:outer membrane receptor protein involved in Fe transport